MIAPDRVFVPDELRIAPTSAAETVTPSPEIVMGSAELIPPDTSRVAFEATVVEPLAEPRALELAILTTPAEIVVSPLYVLVPESVNVPVPCLVTLPFVPEMTPANVVESLLAVVRVFEALVVLRLMPAAVSLDVEVAIDATVSS